MAAVAMATVSFFSKKILASSNLNTYIPKILLLKRLVRKCGKLVLIGAPPLKTVAIPMLCLLCLPVHVQRNSPLSEGTGGPDFEFFCVALLSLFCHN